jgi:hypothetical protein
MSDGKILSVAELQQMLERMTNLAAHDQRINDLLLGMSTTMADMHAHQVGQAEAVLNGLTEAVRGIQFAVPTIHANVSPTPLEVTVAAPPGNTWSRLEVQCNTNMHGQMNSFTITKVE